MTRPAKYDILFEPIRIGPKVLKNRFYQPPHCIGAGSERPGMQAHLRAMKAEGGWAAVCTEYCSIHPESDDTHRVSARLWDDEDVRNLSLMTEMIHERDALAGVQLWYGGPHARGLEAREVPRGPSQIPSELEHMVTPRSMTKADIRTVQRYYVDAALRAEAAGFDIVYVYGAHSYLPLQFLSPFYNKRSDEYGGSFENRARFWMETIELVREAIGDTCAIAARFAIDTLYGDRGIEVADDGAAFVAYVDHLVDLWDITIGDISDAGQDAGPSRFYPENRQEAFHRAAKQHSRKPVVGVGRFTNADTMVALLESGQLDIIGCARPSIADPFLPTKIEQGRFDEIRECIGCNICLSRWEAGGPIICTQNATMGEEFRRGWHPERFERAENAESDVLVVGAGPAGLECAVVLGKRGLRRVHLVDAEPEVGGIMRWIPQLPGLGEWARVVNYRKIQIAKLPNVEFIPRTRLDAADVRNYGADIVVVATGARWADDGLNPFSHGPIPGADASQPWQLTPEQIMVDGKPVPGDRVVVLDNDGYFMGVSLAERLALEGKTVTVVSHLGHVAQYMHYTMERPDMIRRLRRLGVHELGEHGVVSIEPGQVTCVDLYKEDKVTQLEADAVVLVTARRSDEALFRELEETDGLAVYRIGDCEAPRLIADCVFSGHRLAREIDSDDPATPKAFIRERRVLVPDPAARMGPRG